MSKPPFPVICGICKDTFFSHYDKDTRDGATMDCPNCEGLILGMPNGSTVDFHLHLHNSSGGSWPKDGSGTGIIEIGEEE